MHYCGSGSCARTISKSNSGYARIICLHRCDFLLHDKCVWPEVEYGTQARIHETLLEKKAASDFDPRIHCEFIKLLHPVGERQRNHLFLCSKCEPLGQGVAHQLCRFLDNLLPHPEQNWGGIWQEITICIVAVGWSLTERLTGYLAMSWEVERLGFVYGILLAANYKRVNEWIHKKWLVKSITLMVVSGVVGISYLKFKPIEFYGDYLLKIVLGIVLTAFVIEITSGFKVGNRVNRLLGSVSYEVYLLHEIVFSVIILLIPGLNSGVFIIGSIAITVILGVGLKKISDSIMRIHIKQ